MGIRNENAVIRFDLYVSGRLFVDSQRTRTSHNFEKQLSQITIVYGILEISV